jgi:hypothetical protein
LITSACVAVIVAVGGEAVVVAGLSVVAVGSIGVTWFTAVIVAATIVPTTSTVAGAVVPPSGRLQAERRIARGRQRVNLMRNFTFKISSKKGG